MARKATIGPEIFDRVMTLEGEGKTRSEAFRQIGEERASQPGTVSANFYRVARTRGKTKASRKPRTTSRERAGSPTSRPRRAAPTAASDSGDIRKAAAEIARLTQQLVKQVEERDRQIRSLLA